MRQDNQQYEHIIQMLKLRSTQIEFDEKHIVSNLKSLKKVIEKDVVQAIAGVRASSDRAAAASPRSGPPAMTGDFREAFDRLEKRLGDVAQRAEEGGRGETSTFEQQLTVLISGLNSKVDQLVLREKPDLSGLADIVEKIEMGISQKLDQVTALMHFEAMTEKIEGLEAMQAASGTAVAVLSEQITSGPGTPGQLPGLEAQLKRIGGRVDTILARQAEGRPLSPRQSGRLQANATTLTAMTSALNNLTERFEGLEDQLARLDNPRHARSASVPGDVHEQLEGISEAINNIEADIQGDLTENLINIAGTMTTISSLVHELKDREAGLLQLQRGGEGGALDESQAINLLVDVKQQLRHLPDRVNDLVRLELRKESREREGVVQELPGLESRLDEVVETQRDVSDRVDKLLQAQELTKVHSKLTLSIPERMQDIMQTQTEERRDAIERSTAKLHGSFDDLRHTVSQCVAMMQGFVDDPPVTEDSVRSIVNTEVVSGFESLRSLMDMMTELMEQVQGSRDGEPSSGAHTTTMLALTRQVQELSDQQREAYREQREAARRFEPQTTPSQIRTIIKEQLQNISDDRDMIMRSVESLRPALEANQISTQVMQRIAASVAERVNGELKDVKRYVGEASRTPIQTGESGHAEVFAGVQSLRATLMSSVDQLMGKQATQTTCIEHLTHAIAKLNSAKSELFIGLSQQLNGVRDIIRQGQDSSSEGFVASRNLSTEHTQRILLQLRNLFSQFETRQTELLGEGISALTQDPSKTRQLKEALASLSSPATTPWGANQHNRGASSNVVSQVDNMSRRMNDMNANIRSLHEDIRRMKSTQRDAHSDLKDEISRMLTRSTDPGPSEVGGAAGGAANNWTSASSNIGPSYASSLFSSRVDAPSSRPDSRIGGTTTSNLSFSSRFTQELDSLSQQVEANWKDLSLSGPGIWSSNT